jgi:hypothetical protein
LGADLIAQGIAARVGAKLGTQAGSYLSRKLHEKGIRPCFPAGTMLKTPTGWKAVEEFRAGDAIVSRPEYRPEATNTVRPVTRLLTRAGKILTLWVNGRVIETTHEHPWWVVGKGWTTANSLQVNDEFLTSDNRKVLLERIVDEDRYLTVYNLEVEADHTYFVGGENWDFDVWSHNHDETQVPQQQPQQQQQAKRRLSQSDQEQLQRWQDELGENATIVSEMRSRNYTPAQIQEWKTKADGIAWERAKRDSNASDTIPKLQEPWAQEPPILPPGAM